MQACCVECRKMGERKSTNAITMKNCRPAAGAVCLVCGTKMFRIDRS
jgi:hypothetical protein